MRHYSLLAILLFLTATIAFASPATPNPITVSQPDGSTLSLRMHGDEFLHWYTSLDGKTCYAQGKDGWWRPSPKPSSTQRRAAIQRRNTLMGPVSQRGNTGLGMGNRRFLVIMAEFPDKHFNALAGPHFRDVLNTQNYSEGSYVGSARDYFVDASYGMFTPQFDVFGPITMSFTSTDFPENDQEEHFSFAAKIVEAALTELASQMDLSIYDTNNDGVIDNIFMIYPGHNQAEGGGANTIWPHKSGLSTSATFSGKKAGTYSCTSEFRGSYGSYFAGIGTFCHEFSHVIGLPDFYDTDYEDNGEAFHPAYWSLMASGNYLQNGMVPSRYTTYERYMMGFITETEKIDVVGARTISNIDGRKAYILPTRNDGEFFLLEVRDGQRFDSSSNPGLLIYHIDRSANSVAGVKASYLWDYTNKINAFGGHPCCYIKMAGEGQPGMPYQMSDPSSFEAYYNCWVFPGATNPYRYEVTHYLLAGWDGEVLYELRDIYYNSSNKEVTFNLSAESRAASGRVTGKDGKPIKGAFVYVSSSERRAAAKGGIRLFSRETVQSEALSEAITDANGHYYLSIPSGAPANLTVSVFAQNYLAADYADNHILINKDFSLDPVISVNSQDVTKVEANASVVTLGIGSADFTIAQKFTAAEMARYAGKSVSQIAFYLVPPYDEVWAFVDNGSGKVVSEKVTLTSGHVHLLQFSTPVSISGKDVIVGYTVKNATERYPIIAARGTYVNGDFLASGEFGGANPILTGMTDLTNQIDAAPVIAFTVVDNPNLDERTKLADLGISFIKRPSTSLHAGQSFKLELERSRNNVIDSLKWSLDGQEIDGDTIILTAGEHVIKADILYHDYTGGSAMSDSVEMTINVL